MDEPLIVKVIRRYYPDWEAPTDRGRDWAKCLCPFHGDGVASAGVSYRLNGFRCLACGAGGSAIGIIKQEEGVTHSEAVRLAETLVPGSNREVQPKPARKSRRRVFGDEGAGRPEDPGVVPPRVRKGASPWA